MSVSAISWARTVAGTAAGAAGGAGGSYLFGPASWRASASLSIPAALMPLRAWGVLMLAGGAIALAGHVARRRWLAQAGHGIAAVTFALWAGCLWAAWVITLAQQLAEHDPDRGVLDAGAAPFTATVIAVVHGACMAWMRGDRTALPPIR